MKTNNIFLTVVFILAGVFSINLYAIDYSEPLSCAEKMPVQFMGASPIKIGGQNIGFALPGRRGQKGFYFYRENESFFVPYPDKGYAEQAFWLTFSKEPKLKYYVRVLPIAGQPTIQFSPNVPVAKKPTKPSNELQIVIAEEATDQEAMKSLKSYIKISLPLLVQTYESQLLLNESVEKSLQSNLKESDYTQALENCALAADIDIKTTAVTELGKMAPAEDQIDPASKLPTKRPYVVPVKYTKPTTSIK